MKPSEILDKAADLIEPEGAWTQGAYTDALKSFCPLGAVAHVARIGCTEASLHPAAIALSASIDPTDECAGRVVARWNDDPSRTQAEVVTALREAADLARKDGQ